MGVVSDGILRMPPDCWSGDALDVAQRHNAYVEAANELAKLRAANKLDTLLAMLKPLVWEQASFYHASIGTMLLESWVAKTLVGSFSVCRSGSKFYWDYHDGDAIECKSIDHGKELCQTDYQSRVRAMFEG